MQLLTLNPARTMDQISHAHLPDGYFARCGQCFELPEKAEACPQESVWNDEGLGFRSSKADQRTCKRFLSVTVSTSK